MLCPECNIDSPVVDTRLVGGSRKRRYKCPKCKEKFTTIEVYDDSVIKKATKPWEETIDGIKCTVERKVYHDVLDVYTFTVPGWPECSVSGKVAARRTIRGRLDFAVRNTLGIDDDPPKEVV